MSDLTGKTITIPADLWGGWTPRRMRTKAGLCSPELCQVLTSLADETERQHPPRMDEPKAPAFVEASIPQCAVPEVFALYCDGGFWRDVKGRQYEWEVLVNPRPVAS